MKNALDGGEATLECIRRLGVDYIIPGNDDSNRAIRLYARGLADAILEGKSMVIEEMVAATQDEYVEVDEASEVDAG